MVKSQLLESKSRMTTVWVKCANFSVLQIHQKRRITIILSLPSNEILHVNPPGVWQQPSKHQLLLVLLLLQDSNPKTQIT